MLGSVPELKFMGLRFTNVHYGGLVSGSEPLINAIILSMMSKILNNFFLYHLVNLNKDGNIVLSYGGFEHFI